VQRLTITAALVLAACSNPSSPANVTCTPGTNPATLVLGVGGVQTLNDATAMACVSLAASSSPSEYIFISANARAGADTVASYRITTAVAAAAASGVAARTVDAGAPAPAPNGALELGLRATERRLLRLGDARAYRQAQLSSGVAASVVATVPVVGDTLSLNVPNAKASSPCTGYFAIKAVVKYVSTHAIVVQDTAAPAGGFSLTDFQAIAAEFDTATYATDSTYFGPTTDLDANGHVYLLYTPRVNAITAKGSGTYIAGFFFGGDLFPTSLCAESNNGEIVYLLVPDPTGVFSDPRQTTFVRQVTRSTIAHEVEHMINLGVRLSNPSGNFESIWLDEALAHFAEEYTGRMEDGFAPFQKLTYAAVTANATDYTAFYRSQLRNLQIWLQRPDTGSSIANTDGNLSDGGAAWALLHYTADQYAGGNLAAFTRRLVTGPDSGLGNLTSKAGNIPFDSLMAGWMVAMYADGLGIPGLSARYTFQSWNFRDAETGLSGSYPLQVSALGNAVDLTTTAHAGSGTYSRLTNATTTPPTVFRLVSPAGNPLTFGGARLYILRTQ
jgi:hypothetical protein